MKNEYTIEEISIFEDKIKITEKDLVIDKSKSFEYGDKAFKVPGFEITYHIPLLGGKIFFSYIPIGSSMVNPPIGIIAGSEILCSYEVANYNEDDKIKMNMGFQENLTKIKDRVLRINKDIINWNNSLENLIREKIKSIKEEFNWQNETIKNLKYPLVKNIGIQVVF